jgi:hypothetical protein
MGTHYKKLYARVSDRDFDRLEYIRKKFGFKSKYEIQQCLIKCFLKSVDSKNEKKEETVSDEISEMFKECSESESPKYAEHKRAMAHKTLNK